MKMYSIAKLHEQLGIVSIDALAAMLKALEAQGAITLGPNIRTTTQDDRCAVRNRHGQLCHYYVVRAD